MARSERIENETLRRTVLSQQADISQLLVMVRRLQAKMVKIEAQNRVLRKKQKRKRVRVAARRSTAAKPTPVSAS